MGFNLKKYLSITLFVVGFMLVFIQDMKGLSEFLKSLSSYFTLIFYAGLILMMSGYIITFTMI